MELSDLTPRQYYEQVKANPARARFGFGRKAAIINVDPPYAMRTNHGPVHSMPISHDMDDQTIILGYHQSEDEFVRQVHDAFDVHYAESESQGGRVFTLTIHPWMSGQPHRIKALEAALSYVMGFEGVWSARARDILAAFKNQG